MGTASTAIAWFAAIAGLIFALYRLCRGGGRESTAIAVTRTLLVAWSILVAVAIVAGSLGVLTPGVVLGGPVAVALAIGAGARGLTGANMSELPRRFAAPARRWDSAPLVLWCAVAAVAIARVVDAGLLRFPTDWDTLAYHVPLVDHWLQEQRLYVPACAFWYMPGNNELWGLWCAAPFDGDFLVALNNAPSAVLLAVCQFQLLAQFVPWRPICHVWTLSMLMTQPVLRQLVSAENDMAAAALFVAAMLFGVRFIARRAWWDALFSALSIGLLAGTKYYALGYALAALLSLTCGLATRHGVRLAARFSLLAAGCILLLGSYWYVRNWWHAGTPIYPKGLLGARDVWSEMRPEVERSSLLRSGRDDEVWPLYIKAIRSQMGPFGIVHLAAAALFAAVLAPVAAFAAAGRLVSAGQRSRRRASRSEAKRLALYLSLAVAVGVLVTTPNTVETSPGRMNQLRGAYLPARFSLSMLSLGAVCSAMLAFRVVRAIRRRARSPMVGGAARFPRLGGTLVTAGALASIAALAAWQFWDQVVPRMDMDRTLLTFTALALLSAFYLGFQFTGRIARVVQVAALLAMAIGASVGAKVLADRWHRGFATHFAQYLGTQYLVEMTLQGREGERVCVCDYRYYPFFGDHRQFQPSRPLWLPRYEDLREFLRRHRASLLVSLDDDANPQAVYRNVSAWVRQHPEAFDILDERNGYIVARVRPALAGVSALVGGVPRGED